MENFPRTGPVIVASNHASLLDPIIVGIAAPRRLNYMAKDTLFKNRLFAWIIYSLGGVPLKREGADVAAFKEALNRLTQGKPVLVFPEGTRSKDGDLQRPRPGIGFLEANSSALILPCYIKGSIDVLPAHSLIPRPRPISIYFGRPMKFDDVKIDKKDRYIFIAEKVMERIAELKTHAGQGS